MFTMVYDVGKNTYLRFFTSKETSFFPRKTWSSNPYFFRYKKRLTSCRTSHTKTESKGPFGSSVKVIYFEEVFCCQNSVSRPPRFRPSFIPRKIMCKQCVWCVKYRTRLHSAREHSSLFTQRYVNIQKIGISLSLAASAKNRTGVFYVFERGIVCKIANLEVRNFVDELIVIQRRNVSIK